jgi:small subunit ribosomal protein S1
MTENQNVNAPVVEGFDWASMGKKDILIHVGDRKKLEEVYEQTLSSIVEQQVVEGVVVAKGSREVVVNIGYKSDGIVNVNEFRYNPDLKAGDKV